MGSYQPRPQVLRSEVIPRSLEIKLVTDNQPPAQTAKHGSATSMLRCQRTYDFSVCAPYLQCLGLYKAFLVAQLLKAAPQESEAGVSLIHSAYNVPAHQYNHRIGRLGHRRLFAGTQSRVAIHSGFIINGALFGARRPDAGDGS